MREPQQVLVIDNSNSRTKFCLYPCGEMRILPTCEVCAKSVSELLHGWNFARACICSVVPEAAREIVESLGEIPCDFVRPAEGMAVDFSSYPGVATLGADRVANVLAAVRYAELPLVAIDAGTATTLDVVVQRGGRPCFAGGMIAPGIRALADSLRNRTAMLPECDWSSEGPVIGQSTVQSMASAVRIGYPGMMDALLEGIEAELGQSVNVVLTGGDADFLSPRLRHPLVVVPGLTLEGTLLAADLSL
ncbi:MAG: type III pantothenate kinase [Akkermansia sp.]|nr:type III pantothenate kinase [Akkermansia sp.]